MPEQTQYKTKNYEQILEYLKTIPGKHVTIQEVAAHFSGEENHIGQTTVYRQMERLVAEGKVQKYILDGTSACFEYVGGHDGNCFHLKCVTCGKLIHLECSEIMHIQEHILAAHDFTLDMGRTVFYGLCKNCRK